MNRLAYTSLLIIIGAFSSAELSAQAEENYSYHDNALRTTLSVHLSGRKQLIFNTADAAISFKNPSLSDTTLVRHIFLKKPAHLSYNNVIINKSGSDYQTGNLLLLPGDSTVLTSNGQKVFSSTGFNHYIDSFLAVPLLNFPMANRNMLSSLDSSDLPGMFAAVRNNFVANEKQIGHLPMKAAQQRILHTFNYIVQARQVCAIPFDKVKNNEILLLDSAYADILLHTSILDSVSSGFCSWIYDHLIRYSAYRKGVKTTNFWQYFDKADSSVTSKAFYQPYLIACLSNTYKNSPEQLGVVVSGQNSHSASNALLDTIYQLAAILYETKINYKEAKRKLDTFANGRYAFLLSAEDDLHREQRSLRSLPTVYLVDFSGRKISLTSLLNNSKEDIRVLDFWASWCVPCIADYPHLKKVQAALTGRSIAFISISIDTDEDKDAWIKRTKELHTVKARNQYRLVDSKHSPVNKFFNLYSIPRYIVINKEGKILEEDFTRPNEAAFRRKLEEHLRVYK